MKNNSDKDVVVASAFAHILKKRSYVKDYKSLIGKGSFNNHFDEKIASAYGNAHMVANMFESAVVGNYFITADGNPVKLATASSSDNNRGAYTTYTISYGPLLKIDYTFPTGNQNAANTKAIPASQIKRK